MAKLGRSERKFCVEHGIPFERLFDATGLKRTAYREIMKREELWAAYGVTTCIRGHTLRNRSGSCLPCNTFAVTYLLRPLLPGFLYVAESGDGKFMKLGFSQNPENRIYIANLQGWGDYANWRLRAAIWAEKAGCLENTLLAHFKDTQRRLAWVNNGIPAHTREAFASDVPSAVGQLMMLGDGALQVF